MRDFAPRPLPRLFLLISLSRLALDDSRARRYTSALPAQYARELALGGGA